ncbi:MAG: ABC transporter permease subunit, partial [Planctomycetes bacterium]|nr:ABC transporter permease subunit [Planctomycetota bacterium]
MMEPQHETYWDIVWNQFRRNRLAIWATRALVPLVSIAVLAPLICSNQPFIFFDGDQVLFPWLRALFVVDQPVDYLFNMALLGGPAWALTAWWQNRRWKQRGWSAGRRWWWLSAQYVAWTVGLAVIFWLPVLRPRNTYAMRVFTAEQFQSPATKRGIYPPVPFGTIEQDLVNASEKPPLFRKPEADWRESNDGSVHLLGTDNGGRDIFTRMVFGTRISITVGIMAVGLYLSIGCVVGAVAGYFGGVLDMLISRVIEVVLLFPAFFLILTLVGIFGSSVYIIMFVIGITGWPTVARLIRGEVLKQRAADYVSAAQALGFSNARI